MRNTSRNFLCIAFALLLGGNCISAVRATELNSVNSMSQRLSSSTAYGIGVVSWGSVAQNINGRAQLFTYEIKYGSDATLRICTERQLHPGQKVFFAVKTNEMPKNRSCISKAYYLQANQFTQFIYAGFGDLIAGKTWFEVPSGVVEKFDCNVIDVVQISSDEHSADGQRRSNIQGIIGIRSYFSDVSLMQCLKLQDLPQYKEETAG